MKPDGRDVKVQVLGIFDRDGLEQPSAPHPQQELHLALDAEAEPGDILRMAEQPEGV